MNTMAIAALALLAASVVLGIWMGITGQPYSAALLTMHKLASIAFIVLCVVFCINIAQVSGYTAADVVLIVIFIISAAALPATGGIMSAKAPSVLPQTVHITATGALSISACWKLVSYLIG